MTESSSWLDALPTTDSPNGAQFDGPSADIAERVRQQQSALLALMKSDVFAKQEKDFYQALTEMAAGTLAVSQVSIWRFSADEKTLVLGEMYDAAKKMHRKGMQLEASRYPAYFNALKLGRVMQVTDAQIDPRTMELSDEYLQPGNIVSMLDAGIWQNGRCIGVLCMESVGERRLWEPDESQFAATIADIVVIHRENHARPGKRQKLPSSRGRFSQIFSMSQDMMIITRLADGLVLDVNDSFVTQTGYRPDEIIGKSARDLGLWVDSSKRDEWQRLFFRDGEVRALEVEMRQKSGYIRTHQLSSERIQIDGEPCAITISRDFTDVRRHARMVFEIAQGVAAATGESFFRSLVECLLNALDADMVLVGELGKNDQSIIQVISAPISPSMPISSSICRSRYPESRLYNHIGFL